jgi:hypothetical protein
MGDHNVPNALVRTLAHLSRLSIECTLTQVFSRRRASLTSIHKVGGWIADALEKEHLGQLTIGSVPRILGPIVSCLENLEQIYKKDEGIQSMIDNGFGGIEKLRKDILFDFFRSAFDGSGSDLWYDAGSCVDGR